MTEDFLTRILTFQFHKGTIKTALTIVLNLRNHYFNSIKVRLKRDEWGKWSDAVQAFQFHKGTIKTFCFCLFF